MNNLPALLSLMAGAMILIVVVAVRVRIAERIHRRLRTEDDEPQPLVSTDSQGTWLARWIYLAGFRSRHATSLFVLATTGLLVFGGLIMFRFQSDGTVNLFTDLLTSIPGGAGNVLVPFALASPWLVLLLVASLPALVVRAARRKRVQQVEEDLPLILDLLNTLAQAGIGFDAALDRILGAQPQDRPLIGELRSFQYDILAGRPRVESLRRLSRRLEIPTFSTFVSAIIQAEQVGASIAQTLRVQAHDLRGRRREKASAAAMAVPTKLVVPMVIGFLPGVFVALLGPMLFQVLEMMERTFRSAGG